MSKQKPFDAVAFMRKRREEIDQEDAALSWAEKREKTRQMIEDGPLYQRLKHRMALPNSGRNVAVHEPREPDYGKSTDLLVSRCRRFFYRFRQEIIITIPLINNPHWL